ncbi:MAG: zinc-dependent metalloprotease [Pseudomonadota bacterium]
MNFTKKLLALFVTSLLVMPVYGDDDKKDDKEKEKPKTIAELTEDHSKVEGMLTLFRDEKTGALKLLIPGDRIGDEFVYFAQAADGVVQTGYFRGAYLANSVVKFQRDFDDIEIVAVNTSYYFDKNNAISRAASANISDSILARQKILAEDETTGDILIDADPLFLKETMLQVKPSPNPDADPKAYSLGSLSSDKTKVIGLRSYPENSDIEVEYVYSNGTPVGRTGADITDPRNVSVRVLHSIIAMPENSFEPRLDDPRVGFFTTQVTDLTTDSPTPYRDLIDRWHLEKKDPSAAVSDPVEPITYWIENTTPVEWRELIRDAALEWNKSFEKAGISNAVAIKVQPDDADWDAGDIRYNVLRWTSSPNPPFGGYGPSFVNPRTGQIMGADIMLEYSFLNRGTLTRKLLSEATVFHDHAPTTMAMAEQFCSLGAGLHVENAAAAALMSVNGDGDLDEQLKHDAMHYLILHEIGHTLGLNHNMKATQLLSPTEALDKAVVESGVLAGSVMDYPAVNYAPQESEQTLFYTVTPGPYDDWAIRFGYAPEMTDPDVRAAHLAQSTEAALAFGNDADDMRSPGKGIDPLVNIYDMTDDAVGYASTRMTQVADAFPKLVQVASEPGESYQATHDGFVSLMRSWGRSASVVSRYIGGVHVNRGMVGQPGGEPPYTPVDAATQRRAMAVLRDQVFAPDVLLPAENTYRYLAEQRRGFNFFGGPEDPKIHATVSALHATVLAHVLHPNVMGRLSDSALYGNGYSLAEMMGDLTDAVFEADARGDVNTVRQNLQVQFVRQLTAIAEGKSHDSLSQSMAIYQLQEIERLVDRKRGSNTSTKAHVAHLKLLIERALDDD